MITKASRRKKTGRANGTKKFEPSKLPCRTLSPSGNGVKLSCEETHEPKEKNAVHSATIERNGTRIIRRWQSGKWLDDIEVDVDGAKTLKTSVNGQDAEIVIDGASGEIIAGVSEHADPDVVHDILKRLAIVNGELGEAEREKKAAAENHKAVQTRQNNIVSELVRIANGEQMLPGLSATAETFSGTDEDAVAEDED